MQADAGRQQEVTSGQFLTFYLGNEAYGVDILRVQEIRGWETVRALPDAPEYVKGVLDLRGIIVPIVDLRLRFGNESPVYESTTVVIIVAVGQGDSSHLVGVVVDGVSDVLDASDSEIKPPPRLAGSISQRYLHGMVSLERGMVVLVDIDNMLNERELLAELERLGG
jgi:purine-binding chemotaxis protein CheW